MTETITPGPAAAELEYSPWNNWGHRRVYVKRAGIDLGWFHPDTREPAPKADEHLQALTEAAVAWVPAPKNPRRTVAEPKDPAAQAPVDDAPSTPVAEGPAHEPASDPEPSTPAPVLDVPDLDLAGVQAGERTQAKADELKAGLSWWTRFWDRGLGRKTDYEAWRRGALGERIVGKELECLGEQWRVLHSLPDGNRGADIDHLLIGPGGVFAINTKNHARVPVKVTTGAIYVSGYRTEYLKKARAQAGRATARLGATVFPMVCIIPEVEGKYAEKGTPVDVAVVRSDRLRKWAKALVPQLSAEQVEEIYAKARLSSTWVTPLGRV